MMDIATTAREAAIPPRSKEAGLPCRFSVTSRRVLPVYICLQVVLWLISLSVWFPIAILMGITDYAPGVFVPFALVTLVISLALLACYKPVTRFLSKLSESNSVAPNA